MVRYGRRRSDVDLAALVREVAEDADFEARSTNRSVQVTSIDKCSISGVEELLRSAVENVVRNAVRFTAEGTAVEVSLQKTEWLSRKLCGDQRERSRTWCS